MRSISNLSIKYKFLLIPLIAMTIFSCYIIYSYITTSQNAQSIEHSLTHNLPIIDNISYIEKELATIVDTLSIAIEDEDELLLDDVEVLINNIEQKFNEPAFATNPAIKDIHQQFTNYIEQSVSLTKGLINGSAEFSTSMPLIQSIQQALTKLQNDLKQLNKNSFEHLTTTVADVTQATRTSFQYALILIVIAMAALLFGSYFITKLIMRNINNLLNSIRDMAEGEGDTTKRLVKTSNDELGSLVDWFNTFISKLHDSIEKVVISVGPLTTASNDLNTITNLSCDIVTKQVHSSKQVNLAMTEMTETVKCIAESAQDASGAAVDAGQKALSGMEVSNKTINSIKELSNKIKNAAEVITELEKNTSNVDRVLDVIKGVAEQTNLLALNAAIEAARAGEAGRGFAVVADEVRTLAHMTQESTAEIQTIILELQQAAQHAVGVMQESQSQATNAVDSVTLTATSLNDINKHIETIANMNMQIASATEEQEYTTKEIKDNIINIESLAAEADDSTTKTIDVSNIMQSMTDNLNLAATGFKV